MTKSESYSLSSLVSSFDQDPDVDSLLIQIKSLQDEVRRKSAELSDANQRIAALVGINKRISRRATSVDESLSSAGETLSTRIRMLGKSSKRISLGKGHFHKTPTPATPEHDAAKHHISNQVAEIRVCEKSTNKTIFIRIKNLFKKAAVVAI